MTIDQAQDKRKEGFIIVVTNNYKKVLLCTKNEDEAINLKKEYLLKNKVVKIFYPLVKMELTKEDHKRALRELKQGLNCNF